jgi:GTP-binding protein Era
MMHAVKGSLEDADVALLLVDVSDDWQQADEIFSSLRLNVPCIVVLNKIDTVSAGKTTEAKNFFSARPYTKKVVAISALKENYKQQLIDAILDLLPEGEPFYEGDEVSDLSERFFVAELIREKIYSLFEEEIPYQSTVVVQEFKQKSSLIKIRAEIIVQRESQKAIIIGEGGKMIKKLGTIAREDIEKFLQQKVFLELFVKVREKWRDNETFLREYGY